MKYGHIVHELIIAMLVVAAVMIAYMKFSGKPLLQRATQTDLTEQADSDVLPPADISSAPAQAEAGEIPPAERSFLENEALTVFAYGSYHSSLPAVILPPASTYPQVNPARDDAALRPQGEEDILAHNGVFTGYMPAPSLVDSSDLCAALAQPTMLSLRIDAAEPQNYRDVAFVLFNPNKSSSVSYSSLSTPPQQEPSDELIAETMLLVKDIDIANAKETAEYTLYAEGVLVVTAEQLARAAGCF